jgi:hypothetical protein
LADARRLFWFIFALFGLPKALAKALAQALAKALAQTLARALAQSLIESLAQFLGKASAKVLANRPWPGQGLALALAMAVLSLEALPLALGISANFPRLQRPLGSAVPVIVAHGSARLGICLYRNYRGD